MEYLKRASGTRRFIYNWGREQWEAEYQAYKLEQETVPEEHCDVQTTPVVNSHYTSFLVVTQLVEIFETAQGRGWRCDESNGEALSRVLATSIYPRQITGFATAATWLDGKRDNFVHQNDPTDSNPISIGCCVLFLNYLHYRLGYSRAAIVAATARTLVETYQMNLIGTGGDHQDIRWGPLRRALVATFQLTRSERIPYTRRAVVFAIVVTLVCILKEILLLQ